MTPYTNLFDVATPPPTIGPLERLHQLDPDHPDVQPVALHVKGSVATVFYDHDHDDVEDGPRCQFEIVVSPDVLEPDGTVNVEAIDKQAFRAAETPYHPYDFNDMDYPKVYSITEIYPWQTPPNLSQ